MDIAWRWTKRRSLFLGQKQLGNAGNGNTLNANIPNKINALSGLNIVKVSTSGYHCLALANNGDVYSWGNKWQWTAGIR